MDAKTRYRQRLKLRAALTRVLEALAANVGDGIPADRATALMAWQVVGKLWAFTKAAGLDPAELPDRPDLARFVNLKKARKKARHARLVGSLSRCSEGWRSRGSIYYRKGAFRHVSGHFGRTPGSAKTLVFAGFSRVFVGRRGLAD